MGKYEFLRALKFVLRRGLTLNYFSFVAVLFMDAEKGCAFVILVFVPYKTVPLKKLLRCTVIEIFQ